MSKVSLFVLVLSIFVGVTRIVKEVWRLLTAWMSELWREKALKVGIVSYLLKPVSPQTLKQTIEKFTNGSPSPADNRPLEFGSPYWIGN